MPKPVLYFHPLSPPVRSCVMVAKEIGLELELKEVDFLNSEHMSEGFKKINPAQTIPALVDGDVVICDSHAINLYLIEKYARDDYLYPKDDFLMRTTINDRLFFDAGFLFPRGLNIFFPVLMQGKAEVPQEKIDAVHRGYRCLEAYLEKTKYLASGSMTLADLSVFAWMESMVQVVSVTEKEYPKITLWLKNLRKLPYYQEANKQGADLHIQLFNDAVKTNKNL